MIKTLGDPHLGRSFINGTPLHRRGEREEMQWADFKASLFEVEDVQVHVCMGDLFDRWTVPFATIYRAARLYRQAAHDNPDVEYVILNGNHDLSRDVGRISAYHLFQEILEGSTNITFATARPTVIYSDLKLGFIPWNPVHSASEIVEQNAELLRDCDAVFGHWDVMAISDTSNLIPAKQLYDLGVIGAYTGHDHLKRDLLIDGLPVTVTGSMQPYSFAEDPYEELYRTLTIEEYEQILADGEQETLKNLCVRVLLDRGQTVSQVVDCLMFKVKHNDVPDEEGVDVAVELGDFSFEALLTEVMTEAGVNAQYAALSRKKIDEERAKQ